MSRLFILLLSRSDRHESEVDAGEDGTLLTVTEFRCKGNNVGSFRGVDGVLFEVTGENNSSDGRAGQEGFHLVGGRFPMGHSSDSVMVSGSLVAVGEVLGLDNVDHGFFFDHFVQRSEVRSTLEDVFRQGGDVVEDFTFAFNGVFHDLVDGGTVVLALGNHVHLRTNDILALGVNLELTDNGLDHIDFPDGYFLADHQLVDLNG